MLVRPGERGGGVFFVCDVKMISFGFERNGVLGIRCVEPWRGNTLY